MRDFITQVEAAREGNLYYLALAGALMLPDMCAADAEDGTTNRERYGAWFDRWVSPRYVFSPDLAVAGAPTGVGAPVLSG